MRVLEGKLVDNGTRVGIVAARFNEFIVSKLVAGAQDGTEKITTVQKELCTAQKALNSMKTDIHINEAKEAAAKANEDGTKTYKVVLTDEEGTESTVLFSESGEVFK